jgi:hypothetical protein
MLQIGCGSSFPFATWISISRGKYLCPKLDTKGPDGTVRCFVIRHSQDLLLKSLNMPFYRWRS